MSAAIQSYSRSWAGPPHAAGSPCVFFSFWKKKLKTVPGCRVCVFCSSTGSSAETRGPVVPYLTITVWAGSFGASGL